MEDDLDQSSFVNVEQLFELHSEQVLYEQPSQFRAPYTHVLAVEEIYLKKNTWNI